MKKADVVELFEMAKKVIEEFCREEGLELLPGCGPDSNFAGKKVCNLDYPGAGESGHFWCGVRITFYCTPQVGASVSCYAEHCQRFLFSVDLSQEESVENLKREIKERLANAWEKEMKALEELKTPPPEKSR